MWCWWLKKQLPLNRGCEEQKPEIRPKWNMVVVWGPPSKWVTGRNQEVKIPENTDWGERGVSSLKRVLVGGRTSGEWALSPGKTW